MVRGTLQELWLLAFTTLAFAMLGACAGGSQWTLEQVLDRHAEARGGKEALERVASIELELAIEEPTFTVTGLYRASREGFVRIDIFNGDMRVFTEAIGPDGAWQMSSDGVVSEVSKAGIEALQRGIAGNLYSLHERERLGYQLEMVGFRKHWGEQRIVIEERTDTGFMRTYYLDPASFQIASSAERSALHPDLDDTASSQETFWTGSTKQHGVVFPALSVKEDLSSGKQIQRVEIKRREINPAFDRNIFARPTGRKPMPETVDRKE